MTATRPPSHPSRHSADSDLHPFATFIRILGRGPGGSRSLTMDEAETAMAMICAGTAEPLQIGALMALLRYRSETPAELAGMVQALRATINRPAGSPTPDLDWPTYASGGKRGRPWFVLSALLVAETGIRVFMHSDDSQGHESAAARALTALGLPPVTNAIEAGASLTRHGLAFMPLSSICPQLQKLIALRRMLGLRTAANTVARLLNPFEAPHLIQGVFHPPYRSLQQEAAALLGQPRSAVFKGGRGEAERPPHKNCEVFSVDQGRLDCETWPALRPESEAVSAESTHLLSLWRGDVQDDHATALVVGSAAVAFRLLGQAASPAEADALANDHWQRRNRDRFS